jgi:lipoyl(octanoyl) transferase
LYICFDQSTRFDFKISFVDFHMYNQNKKVQVVDLNLVPYQEAWDMQEKLMSDISDIKLANRNAAQNETFITPNYLLFCQHPHVYTLGKSGDPSHLLMQEKFLHTINATFFKTNRGGDITYHGPGQLVGYPIFDLENFYTDIHLYLRMLEEAIILTCQDFGLIVGRIKGLTGVWVNHESDQARKICAFGVKASRWISMHGFAFNVKPDLSYFSHIVPCGISELGVTSLCQELGFDVGECEVQEIVLGHLSILFGFEIIRVPRETLGQINSSTRST